MNTNAEIFNQVVNERRSIRIYQNDAAYDKNIVERSLQRAILSPNSSNMQLWEFYRVLSPQLKEKIAFCCMGQKAAVTAQELVVFVARPDKYKTSIKRNLASIEADDNNSEPQKSKQMRRVYYSKLMPLFYAPDFLFIFSALKKIISFFGGFFHPSVREVTVIDKKVTIHKSVALAAQTFMLSVKAEGYDTCPMEGFDSARVKKICALPRKAQINMIIAVGKGEYPKGVFYPRWRYDYNEVVKEI